MNVNITLPTTITCVARRMRLVGRSGLESDGELPDGVESAMPGGYTGRPGGDRGRRSAGRGPVAKGIVPGVEDPGERRGAGPTWTVPFLASVEASARRVSDTFQDTSGPPLDARSSLRSVR